MWKCAQFEFDTRMPIIMGILNVTPDSFSDGGQFLQTEAAIAQAEALVAAGARIVDVGGESTRPGAEAVSPADEAARVLPVVQALADAGLCVSIDTRHAEVARAAVAAGAAIINDVTGFADPAMQEVARTCAAGLVVTHCGGHFARQASVAPDAGEQAAAGQGAAADDAEAYVDVVAQARDWLQAQAAALCAQGVDAARICLDPGPGFGKTEKQSLELVRNYHEFVRLGYPVCCAVSRKRFVGRAYHIDDPAARDTVSAAEALLACELGCSVVRTHNVEATVAALRDLRPYAFVSMGGNVALVASPGEEREGIIAQLNMAVQEMCLLPDTQIIDISHFYESEPAYYADQDRFVNAVVLLRTGLAPKELLEYLHAIENSLGRVREIPNGPRTLDLDIVDYQTYVVDTELLTLPHARAVERDFVVKPLEELVPGHVLANGVAVASVPECARVGACVRL